MPSSFGNVAGNAGGNALANPGGNMIYNAIGGALGTIVGEGTGAVVGYGLGGLIGGAVGGPPGAVAGAVLGAELAGFVGAGFGQNIGVDISKTIQSVPTSDNSPGSTAQNLASNDLPGGLQQFVAYQGTDPSGNQVEKVETTTSSGQTILDTDYHINAEGDYAEVRSTSLASGVTIDDVVQYDNGDPQQNIKTYNNGNLERTDIINSSMLEDVDTTYDASGNQLQTQTSVVNYDGAAQVGMQVQTTDSNGAQTDIVFGQGAQVDLNNADVALVGDGASATVLGVDNITMTASDQTLNADTGSTINLSPNLQSENISGSGLTVNADGLTYGNLGGDDNTLNDGAYKASYYGVSGNNDQINANGNEYVFNGTGNINVNGSSDILDVNTTNNNILMNNGTINTAPNVNENIGGSGLTVNADGLSGSLFGSDNTLNDTSGNLDQVSLFGQDDIVNADNVNILEEQLTDEGYGDIGSDYYDDFGYDLTTGSSILNAVGTRDTVAAFDVANGFKGDAQVDAEAQQQAILASQSVDAAGAATTPVAFGTAWQPASGASGQEVVTFSFATGSGPLDQPFSSAIGSAYQGVVDEAMQSWSNATGLTFEQVADTPASDIRIGFGAFDTAASGILGYTATRSLGHQLSGAIVRIEDPNEAGISTTANGQQVYDGSGATLEQVALHEIGHALGFADDADPSSVMFTSSSSANQGLDLTDLVGAQMLYGTSGSATATGSSSTSANAGAPPTGFAQMVQAMATFSPQGSSDLSAAEIAAVNTSLAQQLAAPLHH